MGVLQRIRSALRRRDDVRPARPAGRPTRAEVLEQVRRGLKTGR